MTTRDAVDTLRALLDADETLVQAFPSTIELYTTDVSGDQFLVAVREVLDVAECTTLDDERNEWTCSYEQRMRHFQMCTALKSKRSRVLTTL